MLSQSEISRKELAVRIAKAGSELPFTGSEPTYRSSHACMKAIVRIQFTAGHQV